MPISELQVITGRSVLMYPPRASLARLVLPTFAAGSDVSVVIKHEIRLTELFAFVFISSYIILLYFVLILL